MLYPDSPNIALSSFALSFSLLCFCMYVHIAMSLRIDIDRGIDTSSSVCVKHLRMY